MLKKTWKNENWEKLKIQLKNGQLKLQLKCGLKIQNIFLPRGTNFWKLCFVQTCFSLKYA